MIPEGLAQAACKGDATAIRAIADWFRERAQPRVEHPDGSYELGDEELARAFDVYAFEMEVRHVQARLIRRMLQFVPSQMRRGRYSDAELRRFFTTAGLPIEVYSMYTPIRLRVPTDGEGEDETRTKLLATLKDIFPRREFRVIFHNAAMSMLGEDAEGFLPGEDPLIFAPR